MHYSIDQWVAMNMATEMIASWDIRESTTSEEDQLIVDLTELVNSMSENADLKDQLETLKSTLEGT